MKYYHGTLAGVVPGTGHVINQIQGEVVGGNLNRLVVTVVTVIPRNVVELSSSTLDLPKLIN